MFKLAALSLLFFVSIACSPGAGGPEKSPDVSPNETVREFKEQLQQKKPYTSKDGRWDPGEGSKVIKGEKTIPLEYYPDFSVVAVVNKSVGGKDSQKVSVYLEGVLTYEWSVSTGREHWVEAVNGELYLATTPTGFYTPTYLTRLHHSKLWDADMPYAVFFNGGIAMHAAAPKYKKLLGRRASGGCVRLADENASLFFDLVESAGRGQVPVVDTEGRYVLNKDGTIKYHKGWRTLIVVIAPNT